MLMMADLDPLECLSNILFKKNLAKRAGPWQFTLEALKMTEVGALFKA